MYSYNYVFGIFLKSTPILTISLFSEKTYPVHIFHNQLNVTALHVIFGK